MEDTARSVSPAALYEKLEQVYRLLCGKVGSRSLGSGQGRYLQLLLSRDGVTQAELAALQGAPSKQIVETIKTKIREFTDGAAQSDDITQLVIRRK